MKGLGLPYMGSKRKIAENIVGYITTHNPNAKYFYDLFGGGGAISFEALQRKQFKEVHYNEFNKGVVELLLKIRDEVMTNDFYKWISRDEFFKHKDDDTWYGGFLKTCWSFGNNQKYYLYGTDIEEEKRLLHEIIVNKCDVSRLEFDLPCVHEISHRSSLSATNNSKKVVERLFCNKTEFINNKLF